MAEKRTIERLWRDAATAGRTTPAYLVQEGEEWKPLSWAEAAERVEQLTAAGTPGFAPLYPLEWTLSQKIEAIATQLYGADGVEYSRPAERAIARLEAIGLGGLPVCIAKTQYSLSDDPSRLGRPRGFHITVTDVRPLVWRTISAADCPPPSSMN